MNRESNMRKNSLKKQLSAQNFILAIILNLVSLIYIINVQAMDPPKADWLLTSAELAKIWKSPESGNLLVYRTNKDKYVILQSKRVAPLSKHDIDRITKALKKGKDDVLYLGAVKAFTIVSNIPEEISKLIELGQPKKITKEMLKESINAIKRWNEIALAAIQAVGTDSPRPGEIGNLKNRADFDLLINYIIENFEKDPDLVSCSQEILFYPFSVLSNLRVLIEKMAQKTKIPKDEVKNALKWWIHSLHTEAQVAILGYAKPDFSIANPISVASALNPCESCRTLKIIPNDSPKRDMGVFAWCLGDNTIVSDLPIGTVK